MKGLNSHGITQRAAWGRIYLQRLTLAVVVGLAGIPPLWAVSEAEGEPGDSGVEVPFEPPQVRIEWKHVQTSAIRDLERGGVNRSAHLSGQIFFDERDTGRILAFKRNGPVTEMIPDVGWVAAEQQGRMPVFWEQPMSFRGPRGMRNHGEHITIRLPVEHLPNQLEILRGHLELLVARKMETHRFDVAELENDLELGPDLRIIFEQFELKPNGLQFRGEVWSRNGPVAVQRHPHPGAEPVDPGNWRGPFPHLAWLVSESGDRQPVNLGAGGPMMLARPGEVVEDGFRRDRFGSEMSWTPERIFEKIEILVIYEVGIHQVEWELEDLIIPRFEEGVFLF
jgi:hypothetical protein